MQHENTPPLRYMALKDLLVWKPAHGAALLMRHAERYPLRGGWDGVLSTDLTERGWQEARSYGSQLSKFYSIEQIYASPVQRCINTARAILEGAQIDAPVQLRWWLFSPFLKANKQVAPEKSIQILSSDERREAVERIDKQWLDVVLERIKPPKTPGSLTLYIAHDSTVTPMLGYLHGRQAVWMHEYPAFLDGILLAQQGGRNALVTPA